MVTRTVLAFIGICAFGPCTGVSHVGGDTISEITTGLRGLRGVPDASRPAATKNLALQIRSLKPGVTKVGLANALANLSTEGDFGHDTLQEVANTLSGSLTDSGAGLSKDVVEGAYSELAQLERFEHVSVKLKNGLYLAAKKSLDQLEARRSRVDFTLSDIVGKSWTLSSLKGKVVVVNFWATWCPPCRKEMPDLQALFNEYESKGFVILAISDEDKAKVQGFIAQKNYTYPVLIDTGRKVNEAYGIEGIPHSFVYDRQGRLAAEAIDMRTRGQFLKLLAKAGLK